MQGPYREAPPSRYLTVLQPYEVMYERDQARTLARTGFWIGVINLVVAVLLLVVGDVSLAAAYGTVAFVSAFWWRQHHRHFREWDRRVAAIELQIWKDTPLPPPLFQRALGERMGDY
jgi:hypothetical protein